MDSNRLYQRKAFLGKLKLYPGLFWDRVNISFYTNSMGAYVSDLDICIYFCDKLQTWSIELFILAYFSIGLICETNVM